MKTVRPMNNTPTPKLMVEPKIKQSHDILVDDNTNIEIVEPTPVPVQVDLTIENLMDEIIKQKDDRVQITISLTKRQYDLYLKKGGESWVKKALVGVKTSKKKKK